MAFTRKNVAAAVAGTLSLAMLTGCPAPAPTGTSPSAPTSAAPSAPTSAAPTTATSAAPSAQPSGTASGAPASAAPSSVPVSAPPASGKTVIVSGNIYNEKGATVDGATITVKSLDVSVPYTATVTSVQGSYVVNNVPEGANVEIVATKDGWTSRKRVGSFQQAATGKKNIQNFGGATLAANPDDPDGGAYFISDYPEIVTTSPADEDLGVDGAKTAFKVSFSEALDEDSRDAFEAAFHIVPANDTAGNNGPVDLSDLNDDNGGNNPSTFGATYADVIGGQRYTLGENDTFLGSSKNKFVPSWNAANTEVTFTFDGSLRTGENTAGKYNALLISGGADDMIEDAKGNQLGTDDAGSLTEYPGTGEYINNAFKDKDLAVQEDTQNTSFGTRWQQTHKSAIMFEVKKDTTDPKLTGIAVVKDNQDLRLELTFSEPMAAYNGNGEGTFGDGYQTLTNYTFMLGINRGDLSSDELDGEVTDFLDVETNPGGAKDANLNAAAVAAKEEFQLRATNVFDSESEFDAVATREIAIEVEPDSPNLINIWLKGRANLFEANLADNGVARYREIKARVEGVEDPAGNQISESDADKNLVTTSL
jgi:hypothetical protein